MTSFTYASYAHQRGLSREKYGSSGNRVGNRVGYGSFNPGHVGSVSGVWGHAEPHVPDYPHRRGRACPAQPGPSPEDGRSKQRPYDSEGAMTDNPLTHTISGRALI